MKNALTTASFVTPVIRLRNITAHSPSGTGTRIDMGGLGQSDNPKVSAHSVTWLKGPASYDSLYSTLKLRSGKWYWEVMASRSCGVAALARLPSRRVAATGESECAPEKQVDVEEDVGMSAWSWAFGSDSAALSLWHKSEATVYGTAETQSHVISVALDADKGHVWFAIDGVWLTGNPGEGADPVVRAYSEDGPRCGFSPAVGRRCETGLVSVGLVTRASSLIYSAPESFSAITSNPCECTERSVKCMEQGGCADEQMSKLACQDCFSSGCDYSQCGLDTRACTAQIGSPECVECLNVYEQCALPECDCIRHLHECMHVRQCPTSATSPGSLLLDSQHAAHKRDAFFDTRLYTEMCILHKVQACMHGCCAFVAVFTCKRDAKITHAKSDDRLS